MSFCVIFTFTDVDKMSKKYLLLSERARLLRQKQFNDLKCQVVFYSRCMMLFMMCGCHALSNSCLTEVYR